MLLATPATLGDAIAAYRKRQSTPSESAEALLAYVNDKNPELRAYLHVHDDAVMQAAREADLAYARENARPLEGALIAVKDNLLVSGSVTSAGSNMLARYVAPFTATAVERLTDAGAIVIGKTNLDEFAMGSSTENSAFDATRNPADPTKVPGGSSGGSAAAVAANMCHAALGSDTGGSIRQPAALCGCVGFKPSYGAVSRYGLVAMASSLDVIGPFAANVNDVRTVFDAMRGSDPRDATSWDLTSRKRLGNGGSLRGVRVGVPREYFLPGLDNAVEVTVQEGLARLRALGAELVDISLPHAEYGLATYYVIMPAEASTNLSRYDGIRYGTAETGAPTLAERYVRSREHFGAEVQRRILIGTYVLSAGYYDAYYRQAQKTRALITRDFTEAWRGVDLIVSPTSPTLAWPVGEKVDDPLSMYLSDIFTVTANLAGIPAISVPCGEVDGLPVGMQLFAPRGEDQFLLDAAESFERSF